MNSKISPREEVLANAQKRLEKDITDYIDECMKKDHPKSFLIAVLHKVQEKYGYLSKENLQAVAYLMDIPAAKVSGVASFYHLFHLKPKGKIVISVCLGTACFVKGAEKVVKKFKEELGIDLGQTTTDNQFTLMNTRCLGMCAMAPVVKIGDDIHAKVTSDVVPALLEKYSKAMK
ncbi:MAG: NADP-reducing hydrogenase subunit HndA [Candidatus Anoxychlamydiales bacterium]|nr:NADP-reducing hydrogenase subunit HndA [Candidatus Anoxychlamydiales bacterium]NGX52712.1 NADP-reducing hydrogenase subunit HndA [Candidatus Anoxychlamydiales bacterium]